MSLDHEPQPQPERRMIRLGEEFTPFTDKYMKVSLGNPKVQGSVGTNFTVSSDQLPPLPFNMIAFQNDEGLMDKIGSFTPFDPHAGYSVTMEDFEKSAKDKKISELDNPKFDKDVLFLSSWIDTAGGLNADDWCDPKAAEDVSWRDRVLKPEYQALLKRLRLQLHFPIGSFEAKPASRTFTDTFFDFGDLYFDGFYPMETGELLMYKGDDGHDKYHAPSIVVPADIEKLKEIRAKFVLAREGLLVDWKNATES